MNRMHPGTIAAIVLLALTLVYVGYSIVVSQRIGDSATTSGVSTRPNEPGSIQDRPATEKPKPPLVDSNVPPASSPNK